MKKFILILMYACAFNTQAAQIMVDTDEFLANNNGNCSINEAVLSAGLDLSLDQCAAGDGDDEIVFDFSLFDNILNRMTVDFTSTLVIANGSLDIVVPNGKVLWLRGNDQSPLVSVNLNSAKTFSLNNAQLSGGFSNDPGGAIVFKGEEASINLDNVNFFDNHSGARGGAIGFDRDSSLTSDVAVNITDGHFSNNSSDGDGGAIYLPENFILTVERTEFHTNNAVGAGGAIAAFETATIFDSIFVDNYTTSAEGGAIYLSKADIIRITDSTFQANRSDNGGAIAMWLTTADEVLIQKNQFMKNSSTQNGGAIIGLDPLRPSGEFLISENLFFSNTADSNGGAIFLIDSDQTIQINFNQFYNNVALRRHGGAMSLITSSSDMFSEMFYELNGNVLLHNSANEQGGAIRVFGLAGSVTFVTVHNSTLAFNQADIGGGIHNFEANVKIYSSTLVHNEAITAGANLSATLDAKLKIANSILAHPISRDNCLINLGEPSSSGANIQSDSSCGLDETSDQLVADPMLSGLRISGNGLPGFEPTVGSPALDTNDTEGCETPDGLLLEFDQQQQNRSNDGDGDGQISCDSGSIEAPINTDLIFSDAFG